MNIDFRSIVDGAGTTYLLFLIVFLLLFIAFRKPRKAS